MTGNDEKRQDYKMPLRCGDCNTEWNVFFSLPMDINVFVKQGRATRCPHCGSGKALMLPSGDFYVEDRE